MEPTLYDIQLEAVTQLRQWSTWSATIQAAALGYVGVLASNGRLRFSGWKLPACILFFCAALVFASLLLGSLPAVVQHLPACSEFSYEICTTPTSIYAIVPDEKRLHGLVAYFFLEIPAILQGAAFVLGFFFLAWAIFDASRASAKETKERTATARRAWRTPHRI